MVQCPDIACLVYQRDTGPYIPHSKDWIVVQMYMKLKASAEKKANIRWTGCGHYFFMSLLLLKNFKILLSFPIFGVINELRWDRQKD